MGLTYIGLVILGLGVIILLLAVTYFIYIFQCLGELHEYLSAVPFGILGIIILFSGILIGVGLWLGFVVFAVAFSILVYVSFKKIKKYKNDKEESKRQERIELAKNIYLKCVDRKISDLNSEKNLAILKMIAKDFGVDTPEEAKKYYFEGERAVEKEKLEEEKSLMDDARNAEITEWEEQKKIAAVKGKEKYIGKCTDPDAAYESLIRLRNSEKRSLEIDADRPAKTHSSAIIGGAVSALAGTGAGIAAAISNEAKNAKAEAVRAERRANLEKSKKTIDNLFASSISDARNRKDYIKHVLDSLCDEDNVQEKFNLLEFSDYSFELMKTGNVKVNVGVKEKKRIKLLDNPGILDGSLLFEVYDKAGNVAATGYYNAPGYQNANLAEVGFGKISEISLVCICYYNAAKITDTEGFTLKIKPVNMWIIEK